MENIKITNEMLNGISPQEAERMELKKELELEKKKCVPCSVDMPPMEKKRVQDYLKKVHGWESIRGKQIRRSFKFKDFKETMAFVNKIAGIAEEQGHHPDIYIFYNEAEVTLWTHKIKGLHENDFIMAAKIDNIKTDGLK